MFNRLLIFVVISIVVLTTNLQSDNGFEIKSTRENNSSKSGPLHYQALGVIEGYSGSFSVEVLQEMCKKYSFNKQISNKIWNLNSTWYVQLKTVCLHVGYDPPKGFHRKTNEKDGNNYGNFFLYPKKNDINSISKNENPFLKSEVNYDKKIFKGLRGLYICNNIEMFLFFKDETNIDVKKEQIIFLPYQKEDSRRKAFLPISFPNQLDQIELWTNEIKAILKIIAGTGNTEAWNYLSKILLSRRQAFKRIYESELISCNKLRKNNKCFSSKNVDTSISILKILSEIYNQKVKKLTTKISKLSKIILKIDLILKRDLTQRKRDLTQRKRDLTQRKIDLTQRKRDLTQRKIDIDKLIVKNEELKKNMVVVKTKKIKSRFYRELVKNNISFSFLIGIKNDLNDCLILINNDKSMNNSIEQIKKFRSTINSYILLLANANLLSVVLMAFLIVFPIVILRSFYYVKSYFMVRILQIELQQIEIASVSLQLSSQKRFKKLFLYITVCILFLITIQFFYTFSIYRLAINFF